MDASSGMREGRPLELMVQNFFEPSRAHGPASRRFSDDAEHQPWPRAPRQADDARHLQPCKHGSDGTAHRGHILCIYSSRAPLLLLASGDAGLTVLLHDGVSPAGLPVSSRALQDALTRLSPAMPQADSLKLAFGVMAARTPADSPTQYAVQDRAGLAGPRPLLVASHACPRSDLGLLPPQLAFLRARTPPRDSATQLRVDHVCVDAPECPRRCHCAGPCPVSKAAPNSLLCARAAGWPCPASLVGPRLDRPEW